MKIIVLVPDLESKGGVSNYYKVLNLSKKENIDYFQITNQKSIFKIFNLIATYIKFFSLIKKYDIIHINPSLGKTATWRDLFFIILSKIRNKKTVVFFRGWNEKYENKIIKSKILSKIFKLYNKSDSFIVLGQYFKNKLLNMGISDNKKFFIETTIADDKYLEFFDINDRCRKWDLNEKVTFLFISRIVKNKGIFLAIEIFSKIQNKYNNINFEFIIAGDGPYLDNVRKYIESKNIKNIIFKGFVENKEKYKLFVDSDIMLFPTKYGEGLPNCILEGMLYGLPIISRINSAIPEWVVNEKNGFLTDSIESDDFIPLISKLIENKQLYKDMAISNYNKSIQYFIPSAIKSRLINIYNNI